MEKLLDSQNPELVMVLTGVRRSGKSSLLTMLKDCLLQQEVPQSRILEINFEHFQNVGLKEPEAFYKQVKSWLALSENSPSANLYLFIDEVQELADWAKIVNSIRAEFKIDIYVTGSNSRMFSGEHLTYLSGRYIQIDVLPLSFREFLDFKGIVADNTLSFANTDSEEFTDSFNALSLPALSKLYREYVTLGSFPAVVLANSEALAHDILDSLYDSVFTRDILYRGGIRDEAAFLRVARFVLDNLGSQTSSNVIANTLKSSGHPIDAKTVDNYLQLMCNAYLLYQCRRYDIRGREHLRTNGKFYVVDLGLQKRVTPQQGSNRGHVTENLVFLELLRRNYDVSAGVSPRSNAEIDFVAQKPVGEKAYIQVCESVLDPNTYRRELAAFDKLNDGYPRILITKDLEDCSAEGVKHMNLYSFLLGKRIV